VDNIIRYMIIMPMSCPHDCCSCLPYQQSFQNEVKRAAPWHRRRCLLRYRAILMLIFSVFADATEFGFAFSILISFSSKDICITRTFHVLRDRRSINIINIRETRDRDRNPAVPIVRRTRDWDDPQDASQLPKRNFFKHSLNSLSSWKHVKPFGGLSFTNRKHCEHR